MLKIPFSFRQKWSNLLFLHYPVSLDLLQSKLPEGLVADSYLGEAWLTIVPFSLTYWMPGIPVPLKFFELNLRTYVRPKDNFKDKERGVYFFCLDASDRLSVEAARYFYHLNYLNSAIEARVSTRKSNLIKEVCFKSKRIDTRAHSAEFNAMYAPLYTSVNVNQKDNIHSWLTERYCLYTVSRSGWLYKAKIEHRPWTLQMAEAEVDNNTLFRAHGFENLICENTLTTYSKELEVIAHPVQRLKHL